MKKNGSLIEDLKLFLDRSPTAWHAVENACQRLKKAGFERLHESEKWLIKPGKSYYVTRNGTSLCAFIAPKALPKRARLLASHTDSPSLKLKPKGEIRKHQAIMWATEVYGAPLLSSWLNRDLGLAGHIYFKNSQGELQNELVCLDQFAFTIPQLAIHLDREVNEKGLQLNKQEHLQVLAALDDGTITSTSLLETLLQQICDCQTLISHDLFFYPLEKAHFVGFNDTLLASYRIDSLASAHAALWAICQENAPLDDEIKMVLLWDNEEVGSRTAQGAESPFLSQVLERIALHFNASREDYFCLLNQSFCFSIDLAHALHPNYADKHDAQHQLFLGKGVVIKHNAQQRYATNAKTAACLGLIADSLQLTLQNFVSRNDIPCGSTIGPIHAGLTGMPTVDLGSSQLSMHSCRELMACQDHLDLCQLLKQALNLAVWPLQENE